MIQLNTNDEPLVYPEYRECFGKRKRRKRKDLYQKDVEESNGSTFGSDHQRAGGFEEY